MQPTTQLEWLCETLNKRLGPPYNLKLEELFVVIPYKDEAEFEFEIASIFKSRNPYTKEFTSQGNDLKKDYPALFKTLDSNKKKKIRVFFVSPERNSKPLVLWTKKFNYPKISQVNSVRPKLVFDNIDTQIAIKEYKHKVKALNN